MKKWIAPEITMLDLSMTANGHNHQKWAEYTKSEKSQSGYYVEKPTMEPPTGDGDDKSDEVTSDTGVNGLS